MKKTYITPDMIVVRLNVNELMTVVSNPSVRLGNGNVDATNVEAGIRDIDFESERTGWEDGLW